VGGRVRRSGSAALIGGALALAYADRHLVAASLTGWNLSNISGQVVNVAVPVAGFILASGGRGTASAGCSWWRG
jgi:hypothetical protein